MTEASADTRHMEDTICRTQEIATQVKDALKVQDEHTRRLSHEIKAHGATKEKIKQVEMEHKNIKAILEQEKREHQETRNALEERERFNAKNQEALKSLADDLVSVRLQNEALRASMEVQRKDFVVNVNWAARHAELKAKVEEIQSEYEKLHGSQLQLKEQLDTAQRAQEGSMGEHRSAVEELEKVQKALEEQQEMIGTTDQSGIDVQEQLAELEILRRQIEMDKEKQKANKEKAKQQLEKSLLAGDTGLLKTVLGAWITIAKNQRLQKTKKDQNRSVAMRAIANSNNAIMDFCLTAWAKILEEKKQAAIEAARRQLEEQGEGGAGAKRARQKALAQLEKQLAGKDTGLLREVIVAWQNVRVERLRKEKAKAMAYRTVAGSTQALLIQIYQAWAGVLAEERLKRERKATGNAKAMRMIANGNNAMLDFCLTQWAKIAQQAAASKRSKECSNTKALRMIANSGTALVGQVWQSWSFYIKKNKDKNKKLRAVERNLIQGDSQLLALVFSQWKLWQEGEHKKKASKIGRMHVAEKAIQGNAKALMGMVFTNWDRIHDQAIEERKREALKNVKGTVDVEALARSREAVEQLRKEMEEMKTTMKDMTKRMQSAEDELKQKNQAYQAREMDLAKIKKELEDSRKKARDINEELTKVGQFLAQSPRRPRSPKRGSAGDATQLPRIDGTSSRPRSGRTRTSDPGKSAGTVPAVTVGSTKNAWD